MPEARRGAWSRSAFVASKGTEGNIALKRISFIFIHGMELYLSVSPTKLFYRVEWWQVKTNYFWKKKKRKWTFKSISQKYFFVFVVAMLRSLWFCARIRKKSNTVLCRYLVTRNGPLNKPMNTWLGSVYHCHSLHPNHLPTSVCLSINYTRIILVRHCISAV